MRLFGTTTSPFVRRVRVVAAGLGQDVEFINTATDLGLAQLRAIAPIGKVPVAQISGRTLFDSRVIIDYLLRAHPATAHAALYPPRDVWRQHNLVNAIDAGLDAAISLFYLRRDGVRVDGSPFAQRQVARTTAVFRWLERELAGASSFEEGLDFATLTLLCTLDWMDFRATFETAPYIGLAAVRARFATEPRLLATKPHI